jgi:hypothetical protein
MVTPWPTLLHFVGAEPRGDAAPQHQGQANCLIISAAYLLRREIYAIAPASAAILAPQYTIE